MKISKSIVATLDTKVWKLKRYHDFFFCYNAYQKSICNVHENKLQTAFEYPQDELTSFDILDDMLLAGTKHGELVLWQIGDPTPRQTWSLQDGAWIHSLLFLTSDLVAFQGAYEDSTLIFSLQEDKIIDTIASTNSNLVQARHKELLVFDHHNGLFFYNWQRGTTEAFALSEKILSPIFSDDGRFIVANDLDEPTSTIELLIYWREDMSLIRKINTLSTDGGYKYLVCDKYLVCTMPDHHEIGIWDIQTGENILRERFSQGWVNHLSFDPERHELIIGTGWEYGSGEYNIEIWKLDF
jgi:WD40 repeat protein